ncbi:hypothetical protein HKX48_001238 [Thoreauomyces humboldtii]|nr:hypothetical protein HKX48_001238 [Thoreauomyces humboldtii]
MNPPTLPEISRGHYKAAEWLMGIAKAAQSASVRGSSIDLGSRRSSVCSDSTDQEPHVHALDPALPTIVTPPDSSRQSPAPGRKGHSRNASDTSISSARVRLLQAESWKINLPTDDDDGDETHDRNRWSRMMEDIIGGGEGDDYDQLGTDGREGYARRENAITGSLDRPLLGVSGSPSWRNGALASSHGSVSGTPHAGFSGRFRSLKTIDSRTSQRVPMYDSHGRRIGVLDQGRFTSGTDEDLDVTANEFISVRGNLLRLNEEGSDVLVMEMVNGKLQIVAGTVEKLVTRLADDNVQDTEFVDVFLQNHPFYISSRDLFANLLLRFHVRPAGPVSSLPDPDVLTKWQRPIRIKVLAALARWVKLRFEDFEADAVLRDGLECFLSELQSDKSFRNEVGRIRRVSVVQAMSICARNRHAPFPDSRQTLDFVRCPFPVNAKLSMAEHTPLLNFEARQLARYLTVADARAFLSISMYDFVNKLKGPSVEERESGMTLSVGKIDLFAKRSDMIRNWIALELCTLAPRKLRRKLLEKLILVAFHCVAHGNFHTSLFILLALHSPPVQRLKRTWDGVTTSTMDKLKRLDQLLDVAGNMRHLRKATETSDTAGVVPFLPVVMKDATFVVEGNPDHVKRLRVVRGFSAGDDPTLTDGELEEEEDDGEPAASSSSAHLEPGDPTIMDRTPAVPPAPLINFDKYRTLAGILAQTTTSVEHYTWGIHLHLPTPNTAPAPSSSSQSLHPLPPSAFPPPLPPVSAVAAAAGIPGAVTTGAGTPVVAPHVHHSGAGEIDQDLKAAVESRLAWAEDSKLNGGSWMKVAAEAAARCLGEDE